MPSRGIELIHTHTALQMPGHLYMHRRDKCSVFCRNYEIDFYLKLENYFNIKTEFEITLNILNKTCHSIQQEEQCMTILGELQSRGEELEEITESIQDYYTNTHCTSRLKRSIEEPILSQIISDDQNKQLSELKIIFERLLKNMNIINA